MRIVIGSDHAGTNLRSVVAERLRARGDEVTDIGIHNQEPVDYPDIAAEVARAVAGGEADRGVLICGSGIGMAMAANKIDGVRAALCADGYSARLCRAHNDANVLCMGERVIGAGVALDIVDAFVDTPFAGGRHARRLDKIKALEQK